MVDVSGGDGGYRSFPGPLAVAEGIVGRWGAREGRTGAWGVVKREVERLGDEVGFGLSCACELIAELIGAV